MNFTSYGDYRNSVIRLIDGDNVSDSSISTGTIDLMISLGEARVYSGDSGTKGLRATSMEVPLSVVVASNSAALPADLLELKEAYFSGERPVEIVGLDRLRALENNTIGPFGLGGPRYAARYAETLRFWPAAGGTLLGAYWKRPADMATSAVWADNTTVNRYPECFIFAALAEAAPFIGEDQRIPMWEGKYRSKLDAANNLERMKAFSGSPLRIRPR